MKPLPCPCCGEQPEVVRFMNKYYGIQCLHCGAQSGTALTVENAILKWNHQIEKDKPHDPTTS